MEQVLDVMKDYWFLTVGVIVIVILLIIVIIINLKKTDTKEVVEEPKKEQPNFDNLVATPQTNDLENKVELQSVNIEPQMISEGPETLTVEETIVESEAPSIEESIVEQPEMPSVEEAFSVERPKENDNLEKPEAIDFWDMNK